MKYLLLASTLATAPFALGQNTGGIGGGFYTEGVDFAGLTWMQRGDNPDRIAQMEVQAEGVDPVFTTGETLRFVTQNGAGLTNVISAQLPEVIDLAEGESLTLSFQFRYVPPLAFGTENQDIYRTNVGLFLDTAGEELIPAYKGNDANWAGYWGLLWMDDSVSGDYDPPRQHILVNVVPGAAGAPINKGTNLEESASTTPFIADEDPLELTFRVTNTAEGVEIYNSIGKIGAEPSVVLTYTDTNTLDAVTSYNLATISMQGFLEAIIANVQITYSGASADWYGYEVLPSGDANTGNWLGWVYVENDPWIWSYSLGKYIYVKDSSGWVFVRK